MQLWIPLWVPLPTPVAAVGVPPKPFHAAPPTRPFWGSAAVDPIDKAVLILAVFFLAIKLLFRTKYWSLGIIFISY
jgi:hypothetical protein